MNPLSTRPSIPVDSATLHHVAGLLAAIEEQRGVGSGVLNFRPCGQIYLEDGKVCWAAYPGQQERLGQLLRYQRSPPIEISVLGQIVDACRQDKAPFAEALLASGEITEGGLRSALLIHSAESIARIANSAWQMDAFEARPSSRHDARFVFSTVELLTQLGAGKHLTLSAVAKRMLSDALVGGGTGLAFVRQASINHPVLIAVAGDLTATVEQAREVCAWTSSLFDLARAVDEGVYMASGSWRGKQAVVSWRLGEVSYAGLFPNRAAAAVALSRVAKARASEGKVA